MTGVYIVPNSPPPAGGGIKCKVKLMGKKMQGWGKKIQGGQKKLRGKKRKKGRENEKIKEKSFKQQWKCNFFPQYDNFAVENKGKGQNNEAHNT